MEQNSYHHGDLRTAILDAAEKVLAEKSLDAISVRELAREAGVSPGAPYHHFGDRTGLVKALCERGFTRLGDALSIARKRGGVRSMIEAYLKFAKENYALYQLMFSAEATSGDLVTSLRPTADPVFTLLAEELEPADGMKSENFDRTTPVSVWCFMHGVASLVGAIPLQTRLGRKSLNRFAYESIQKLLQPEVEN